MLESKAKKRFPPHYISANDSKSASDLHATAEAAETVRIHFGIPFPHPHRQKQTEAESKMAGAAVDASSKKAARREEKQSLLPLDSNDASPSSSSVSPVRKHKSIIVNVCSFILVTEVRSFVSLMCVCGCCGERYPFI